MTQTFKLRKVWVDIDVCLAHYLCVGEASLIFEEVKDGWGVRVKSGVDSDLLLAEAESILWATAICPVAAIKVELDDGRIIDSDSLECKDFLATKKKT
ncbi:hypothetical protein BH11PSE11_BH11PSE11_33030 [soil metagenome]